MKKIFLVILVGTTTIIAQLESKTQQHIRMCGSDFGCSSGLKCTKGRCVAGCNAFFGCPHNEKCHKRKCKLKNPVGSYVNTCSYCNWVKGKGYFMCSSCQKHTGKSTYKVKMSATKFKKCNSDAIINCDGHLKCSNDNCEFGRKWYEL